MGECRRRLKPWREQLRRKSAKKTKVVAGAKRMKMRRQKNESNLKPDGVASGASIHRKRQWNLSM